MSNAAAKQEIQVLGDSQHIQEQIHLPDKDDEILSFFKSIPDYDPITWYSKQTIAFEQSTMGVRGRVTYYLPSDAVALLQSYLRIKLPDVSVKTEFKDKIRIRWTDYVGVAACKSMELVIDSNRVQTFPAEAILVLINYYFEKDVQFEYGNKPKLIQWTDHIKQDILMMKQPFFYSRSPVDHLPCQLNPRELNHSVEHIYTFERMIDKLLQMQELKEKEWVDIQADLKYVDVESKLLDIPQLWGKFAFLSADELSTHRCDSSPIHRYYEDCIHIIDQVPRVMNDPVIEDLKECTMPCRSMFWMAENTASSLINNRFCYTENGETPILHSTLSYGGANSNTTRFEQFYEDQLMYDNDFIRNPVDRGIIPYSFGLYPSERIDVGVRLKELFAVLSLKMKNNIAGQFKIHVILFVQRRLVFTKDKETDRFISEISSDQ